MDDGDKRQEDEQAKPDAEEVNKNVVEAVTPAGNEQAIEESVAATEESPISASVDQGESDRVTIDDHPLGASGEDDYHSADDEGGQKSPESKTPEVPKSDEAITQNGGDHAKTDDRTVETDDAASTSSKESEGQVLGRRRRSASESEEPEDKTGRSSDEKDGHTDDEELDPEVADEQESGEEEDVAASEEKTEPEDRQNPAFVPRRGNFFQHDTRISDEPEKPAAKQSKKQIMMEKQNRWNHDMFDEQEQMPKSRHELVNSYGYDIRDETRAPRDPHGRRYGRSQNMERDWRDPESYGRRSFGGYRRSFGAGGGGRGRGRGRGRGGGVGGHRDQGPTEQQSRSASRDRRDSHDVEPERVNHERNKTPIEGVMRSRSFSGDDRPYDNGKPRGMHRGGGHYGRDGGGSGNQRTFGTVEFRRRGRGTAFSSNQRGSNGGGGRYYDGGADQKMSRRSAEADYDRSNYNDNNRGGRQSNAQSSQQQRQSYQAPPRFQHHQGQRRGGPFPMTNAPYRRSQEHDYNDSNEAVVNNRSPERQQQPFSNAPQQSRNQDRSNPGAKRYSAIRQHSHQQPNMTPSGSQGGMANSVQQGGVMPTIPLVIPAPPPNAAPVTMMATPVMEQPTAYPPSYPPYYNGSGMYQQPAPVPVPEMFPVPAAFGDGSASYVLPQAPPRVPAQAFIGQQQYPPAAYGINQPMPHYSAESRDAYGASGGGAGGGTVYFDPGSQHRSQRYTAHQDTKRRPKGIPIVSPDQAGDKGHRTVNAGVEQ